ncbi:hypothetical protein BGLA2_570014 [Burkholderia gladioli]|nr:hypothetical protein BGLA2_570014 [Burkholderia gladioli]
MRDRRAGGRAARDVRGDARCRLRAGTPGMGLQGLRARYGADAAPDGRRGAAGACQPWRAVGAELRAGGGSGAAGGADRGERLGGLPRSHAAGLPPWRDAHLYRRRCGRRRGGRGGQERAGDRHRHRRRARPRSQCARRADHARAGRDVAIGRGARRPRRNLHGPYRARRPDPHRHRRPVAQPQGRPATGAGPVARGDPPGARPCRRRRALRARGAGPRAGSGDRHADHRGGLQRAVRRRGAARRRERAAAPRRQGRMSVLAWAGEGVACLSPESVPDSSRFSEYPPIVSLRRSISPMRGI